MSGLNCRSCNSQWWLTLLMLLLCSSTSRPASAQQAAGNGKPAPVPAAEQPAAAEAPVEKPLVQMLVISGAIDAAVQGRISNTALTLEGQAVRQSRQALLVLEFRRGTSSFGQASDLARFLSSAQLEHVRTVAWIPAGERIDGNNAVVVLACNEIVMHPDAELGDLGRNEAMLPDQQRFVLDLIERRHNPRLHTALVRGMMDPALEVRKVGVRLMRDGQETIQPRLVTPAEHRELLDGGASIPDAPDTIKPAGFPGLFTGARARAHDVLVTATAASERELATLYDVPARLLQPDVTYGTTPEAVRIRVDGMIEPVLETFIDRQIDRALKNGANLLIFEIESPGGMVHSSFNLADRIADLESENVRTIAWIPEMAYSGAAIVAMGCDEIYMTETAEFGAAAPVVNEGGQWARAPEKVLSMMRLKLTELAQRKGRPAALLIATADKDLRVYEARNRETGEIWFLSELELEQEGDAWEEDPKLVPETVEDNLLTISGRRAHELQIAAPPVASFDELKDRLGISPETEVLPVGRTWIDSLIFLLNTDFAVGMLIFIGLICIYLELHFMSGLLGIVSALCFALFFWSHFLGGTAGWLEVVLFLLGIGCIGLEIFVVPGFGVFGVSGGLLVVSSLILASQTFGGVDPGTNFRIMSRTVGTLSASVASVVVIASLISRFLPHVPVFNQMILSPPSFPGEPEAGGPRLRPDLAQPTRYGSSGAAAMLLQPGRRGVASSVLRPAGKATIEGNYVDVVSDGPYIAAGSEIEIIEIRGNRVVVRQV
ncbi:MAG: hypothetical protein KDA79_05265 [Planctomycetaceae bacterium]|nr:hypothetical protein [Planctomycetaceae bacterium]